MSVRKKRGDRKQVERKQHVKPAWAGHTESFVWVPGVSSDSEKQGKARLSHEDGHNMQSRKETLQFYWHQWRWNVLHLEMICGTPINFAFLRWHQSSSRSCDSLVGDSLEFNQALSKLWKTSDEQEGLECCSPWGLKESDSTERLKWSCFSHIWLFATLWTVTCRAPPSPGKNIGEDCQALLQGIFWTQELNPCL